MFICMYYDVSTKLLRSCTDHSLLLQQVTCVICHWQWETMWVTVLVVNQNVSVIDNLIIKLVTWILLLVDSTCIMTTPEDPLSCCTVNPFPLFSCSSRFQPAAKCKENLCIVWLMNNISKLLPHVRVCELLEVMLKTVKSKDCCQSGGSTFVTFYRVARN